VAAHGAEHLGADPLAEDGRPLAVRAFFGLPVPEAQRIALTPYLAACAAAAPDFRFTPPDNLHITLRFLGQIETAPAEGIVERLSRRDLRGFELELGEVGTFKRGRLVRVVWLGLRQGAQHARALAADVESECEAAGLEGEKRPLEPHLTLARARPREGAPLPALPPSPELPPWKAGALVLYRSRLGRAGSVYEPLRELRLS
jgi:RNA 2',3'-cyclic 3'-phosphodiesterase